MNPTGTNVWPVFGWGVVGRGGGDVTEPPGLVVVHGGAVGMAEWGVSLPDGDGKAELGVGDGSIWNIAQSSAGTDGSVTLDEVEVVNGWTRTRGQRLRTGSR